MSYQHSTYDKIHGNYILHDYFNLLFTSIYSKLVLLQVFEAMPHIFCCFIFYDSN